MLGIRISLIAVALASCGRGDVVSEPASIDAMAMAVVAAYRPLVGTWSGTLQVASVGLVTGVVTVDAGGKGSFFVSVAGVSRSGTIEILELANGQIRARALQQERSVPIVVGEKQLRLEIHGVGELVLTRSDS